VEKSMEHIKVSPNKRFLMTDSGKPFFWLADTAWELFHRLTRQEIETYLENRRQKGFNTIQAVALAEFDGLRVPNMEGEVPFINLNPDRPNDAYFEIIDFTIRLAAEKGLYIALLPTWGDKVAPIWGVGPSVLTTEKAYHYGRWLGARYQHDKNLLWIIGGDRPAKTDDNDFRPIWRALADGIDEGCGFQSFKTYHPNGGFSSSTWLQEEDWLDMHMIQSGHGGGRDNKSAWNLITRDYWLTPIRPTIDGEPNYEDHPVNPWPKYDPANGYFRDHDVRKQCYRSVFAGGCGVTYGHHAIWQFAGTEHGYFNYADRSWQDALDRPGAEQLQYLKSLMLSRSYWTRIPDQGIILSDNRDGASFISATRDSKGSFALIYFPNGGQIVDIDLTQFKSHFKASWFDPRLGKFTDPRNISSKPSLTFTSPMDGPDWVLVLDAKDK
jgi:hypothetical protein